MPDMDPVGVRARTQRHASSRPGTMATASGAMTAAPPGPGAMVVLAAMVPLSTATAKHPLAARGAVRRQTTRGVRTGIQGALQAGAAARQTATAATGQAG
jgi:hypothetical protein